MTAPVVDHLSAGRASLGAACASTNPETVAYYMANARIAATRAEEDLRSFLIVLEAREAELARRASAARLEPKGAK